MRFQTSAIIIVGFLLSHAAGYLFYALDRRDALEMTEAIDLAERAAGISRLVRDFPQPMQVDVVRFSDSRIFRVWVTGDPAVSGAVATEAEKEILTYLRSQVPRIAENEMRARFVSVNEWETLPPPFDGSNRISSPALADDTPAVGAGLAISIRHSGSEWINFLGIIGSPHSIVRELLFANLASAIVGLTLVAFWLVNRVTSPLGRFALAAEELGRDLFRPPLTVGGPDEVMIAAKAFNRMQSRLSRLIQSRTEFLAAISHDLRTPLTQIRLRLEAMGTSREQQKVLRSIDDMDASIGSFLSYARAVNDSEARSKIDLGAMVSSICDDLAECGKDVTSEVEQGMIFSCKRLAIKRALLNIIDNAINYGALAQVSAFRQGPNLIVRVEDDGPGIPKTDIAKALKPFQRLAQSGLTKRSPGSGLGLSIALAIMEDHGGEINFINRPTGGLSVELVFPC